VRKVTALLDAVRASPKARRRAERHVRLRAVAWARANRSLPRARAAEALNLSARTLTDWEAQWNEDRLSTGSRGRPPRGASDEDRTRMLGLLWVLGPTTGWESLRGHFPGVSRRELRRLLRRTRKAWRRLDRVGATALQWKRPGTVWAIDFTQPPTPIEGRYPRMLLVRDLSSGMSLLALPCEDETAATAAAALRSLFLEHGAPLVLKSDNGSAFIAEELKALCAAFRVTLLYSPPYYPAYNGACEAGVGSIKTRTHHLAARDGRAGEWTLDDVEGARLQANETGRPFGASGPVPQDRWNQRRAIEETERDLFREDVRRSLDAERSRRGFTTECRPDHVEAASIERAAIARALEENGLLEFRTRRVSPPISSLFSAIFS
jgi:transposase InsO family protein